MIPILGVAYYPEQWPRARWTQDARLMREAGIRLVRLAEFGWSQLEPQEGQFQFGWLDEAIAILAAEGHALLLGTPTAAPPPWLTERYPEVLPVDARGMRFSPGSRRHVCLNSPTYRELSRRIVRRMAMRYGRHPAVMGWQIDNELGGKDTSRCYCERCEGAFRYWLQARYEGLDALNEAWGTVFWSQTFSAWSQVIPPRETPFEPNPAQVLDFYRFSSETTRTFLDEQVAILREHSPQRELTTNLMMGGFDVLDYPELVSGLDRVGWDNYRYDGWSPAKLALSHDWAWGLKRRNFWVLEQQVGQVNWTAYNRTLAPGEARLLSYQAIARGADMLVYFRWRMALQGAEQYHSALLPHWGVPGRIYAEIQHLAAELGTLAPWLEGTQPQPQVALLQDYENRWALRIQPHHRDLKPDHYLLPCYEALYRRNVPTIVLHPAEDLGEFRLVVAPALHLVDPELAQRLSLWVAAGGTLVLTCRSGFKDRDNRVWDRPTPGPLADLAGIQVEEWDAVGPDRRQHVQVETSVEVGGWCERICLAGAEAVGIYQDGYYAGEPAVTRHAWGQGIVYYVGTLGRELTDVVLERALADARLHGILATPEGVEAARREGPRDDLTFLINHLEVPQAFPFPEALGKMVLGEREADRCLLPPFGVAVFQRSKA